MSENPETPRINMMTGSPILKPTLPYSHWISLKPFTRAEIARIFKLTRTGESVVNIGSIVEGRIMGKQTSDGFKPEDLTPITVEGLKEVVDFKSDDFFELFNALVGLIEGESKGGPIEEAMEPGEVLPVTETTNAKPEKKAKKAKSN